MLYKEKPLAVLVINGSNKVKTSILSYFGDEHKMVSKELVMSVHDWMKPILTNYKNLEHQYDRLGMKDYGSKQSQNDDLETIRLAWCGQGESNSRLILGKDSLYHLTMAANVTVHGIIRDLVGKSNLLSYPVSNPRWGLAQWY